MVTGTPAAYQRRQRMRGQGRTDRVRTFDVGHTSRAMFVTGQPRDQFGILGGGDAVADPFRTARSSAARTDSGPVDSPRVRDAVQARRPGLREVRRERLALARRVSGPPSPKLTRPSGLLLQRHGQG